MGYAFISYSSKNNEYACTIRNILNKNGIETWMAPESIPAGSKYAAEITKAVRNCSCFVLLLSNFSQASDAVDGEVELAKLTFKKPIVTIQIEDVELNDSFLFYLKNTHTVSVYKIEEKSETIKSVLSDIEKYTGKQQIQHNRENSQNLKNLNKNHNIELTVHSPVNTDVYLNNKKHPVMRIDLNSGFNYKHNTINVSESFELIFSSKGFEKIVAFETVGNKIDYNLNAILSQKEIVASYDREEALEQISYEPTSYAFEQLAVVGLAEDTLLLKRIFHELSSDETDDSHKNYLIAECALALGTLAIKYNDFESAREIPSVYEKYPAKGSYGYLFEKIMKNLIKGLNDFTEKSDVITDDMDFEKVLNKKTEERETKSKAEKKTVNKNKFAFSPIAPPARLQVPAVVGKLEQKNDTNNMSSENKSDGFDDDQFYIMINDIIKGKEPECDNENETIDISSKNSSDGFEDDQFYIMIDDIIKGKDGVKKENNEEDALKSVNDAFDKIDYDEHNRINDLLLKKAFEDFDEALNYSYSPEEKIEEINLEEIEADFDDELSLLLGEDNASDNEHIKNELQKLVNEVRLMNKTFAISSVGSADEAFVWLMFFDCELPYINSSVLPNKRTDESFEEYTAECARLAAVNEHTDFGVCISNVHTDKDSLERYIIVCVADSKRAKLKKIYAFDYESQEDMFIVAVIETFKMIIDFNQSEKSHKSSAIFKFISKIKKK